MRGALLRELRQVVEYGIIPAYAGSTTFCLIKILKVRDHPRVCGEHPAMAKQVKQVKGSSPRMRGAPDGGKGCACQ